MINAAGILWILAKHPSSETSFFQSFVLFLTRTEPESMFYDALHRSVSLQSPLEGPHKYDCPKEERGVDGLS